MLFALSVSRLRNHRTTQFFTPTIRTSKYVHHSGMFTLGRHRQHRRVQPARATSHDTHIPVAVWSANKQAVEKRSAALLS